MFTLDFFARPATDEHMVFVRRAYEADLALVKKMQFTQTDRLYGEAFLNSNRPRIQGMVAPLVELGLK